MPSKINYILSWNRFPVIKYVSFRYQSSYYNVCMCQNTFLTWNNLCTCSMTFILLKQLSSDLNSCNILPNWMRIWCGCKLIRELCIHVIVSRPQLFGSFKLLPEWCLRVRSVVGGGDCHFPSSPSSLLIYKE